LLDPCIAEPTDVFENLTMQDREAITSSAQHLLRLLIYRQIYKVLDMKQLPPRHDVTADMSSNKRRITGQDDSTSPCAEEKKLKEDDVALNTEAMSEN